MGAPVVNHDAWTESVLQLKGGEKTQSSGTITIDIPGLGKVTGLVFDKTQVAVFAGIPFAKPPVGDLRWKPPQAAGGWEGTRDGTKSGAQCPQQFNDNEPIPTSTSKIMDEDCLTLDIVVPLAVLNGGAPVSVMQYFFGGSFTSGGTALFGTLGLSEENNMLTGPYGSGSIYVVCNYRLNVLGYLSMRELFNEDPSMATSGNYGIQDQRLATQWSKQYISAFNGNPDRIMIAGQSAGGISVDAHIGSIRTPPNLFAAALSQSGAPTGQFSKLEQSFGYGETFKNRTGCNLATSAEVLACVRALPWNITSEQIASADFNTVGVFQSILPYQSLVTSITGDAFSWRPVLDGFEFPLDTTPLEVVEQGLHKFKGPVMIGNTKNEGTMFALSMVATMNRIQANLTSQFPWLEQANGWLEDIEQVLQAVKAAALRVESAVSGVPVQQLNADIFKEDVFMQALGTVHEYNFLHRMNTLPESLKGYALWETVAAMAGDALLVCPTRRFADALVAHGNPVHEYWFTWAPTTFPAPWLRPSVELGIMGSFHQADMYSFTGTLNSQQFDVASQCGATQCNDAHSVGAKYEPYPEDWNLLVNNFQGFISNFLASEEWDPNSGTRATHSIEWPRLNDGGSRMQIDMNLTLLEGPWVRPQCDFWDKIDMVDLYALLVANGISA
jgi:carboxylesterase type B